MLQDGGSMLKDSRFCYNNEESANSEGSLRQHVVVVDE